MGGYFGGPAGAVMFPVLVPDSLDASPAIQSAGAPGTGVRVQADGSIAFDSGGALRKRINFDGEYIPFDASLRAHFHTAVPGAGPATLALGRGIYFRLTPAADAIIRGFSGGAVEAGSGRVLKLVNASAFQVTLQHQAAGAAAADRIITPTGGDLLLYPDRVVTLAYDAFASRWRVESTTEGEEGAREFLGDGSTVLAHDTQVAVLADQVFSADQVPDFKVLMSETPAVDAFHAFTDTSGLLSMVDNEVAFTYFRDAAGTVDFRIKQKNGLSVARTIKWAAWRITPP